MKKLKKDQHFIASYKLIKESIIEDINNGIYKKGDCIKGQNFYAEKFQVSRTTVRNAINDLVKRGILESVKGKCTYVKGVDQIKKDNVEKLYDPNDFNKLKPSATFHVIKISEEKADAKVAKHLGIGIGDIVVRLERVRMVNLVAGNYQISYINKKLVPDVDFEKQDMTIGSLYSILINQVHLIPQYSDEMIRAVLCPTYIAKYFCIKTNDPILLISRVTYSLDGIVMEYCLDYECTDVEGLKIRR